MAEKVADTRVSYWPRIARDPRGNALLVWDDLDGMVNGKHYDASTQTWSAPAPLDQDNPDDSAAPELAMDASGNGIVVWQRQSQEDDRRSVWTSRYDASKGTWGTANLIINTELVLAPQVAMDDAGNAVLAFTRSEIGAAVMTAHYDVETGSWSAAAPLVAPQGLIAGAPQLAISGGGLGVVVWLDGGPEGNSTMWASRYETKSKTWQEAQAIGLPAEMGQPPRVTINEAGTAVAVWAQLEGERFVLWTSRSEAPGKAWSEPERLDRDAAGDASLPRVVLDHAGNATAIWNAHVDSRAQVWSSRYSAAMRTWSAARTLESGDHETLAPAMSVDGAGNVLVLVLREEATRRSPWASWYTVADGTWSTPVPLEPEDVGASELAQLGLMPDGRALAVWSRERNGIFVSELR